MKNEANSFLCLDWEDEDPYKLYGKEWDTEWEAIEVILAPCNYLHKEIDTKNGLPMSEECIIDP